MSVPHIFLKSKNSHLLNFHLPSHLPPEDIMNSEEPLIDPALLASIPESERGEALAAAAAARRAEERAAKRAAEREQSASINNGDAVANQLTAEEEEARALAEAMEEKRRERERERALAMGNSSKVTAAAKPITSNAAAEGLMFVSKKKRGVGSLGTNGEDKPRAANATSTEEILEHKIGSKRKSADTNGDSSKPQESHLTASQLASIKRAYLGEKALETADPPTSNGNNPTDMRDAISARQKLRAERAKRRVKKTTFKFEWGDEEDTFEKDDPLYGGGTAAPTPSAFHRNNRMAKNSNGTSQRNKNDNNKATFGKRKHHDQVTTVDSVYSKPMNKMTARDWRIFRENYNIVVKGGKSPPPLRSFRETPAGCPPIHPRLIDAIENTLRYKEPSPIQRQSIPIGMQRRDLIGIAETGEQNFTRK